MASIGGVSAFGGAGASGRDGRREIPGPLSSALVLVRLLFAATVVGGLGVLLTASSVDAVDGGLLARVVYAAAPGVLGWWLARRSRAGGVRIWAGLIAVQVWLVLGSISNIAEGSARGFTQLLVPAVVLYLLTRPASRAWYRLPRTDRRPHRPFSLARMIRWRRDDGQTAVEYAGLVAVVVAIISALVVTGLGTQILTGIQSQVCRVTGTACPATGDGDEVTAGDGTDQNPGSDQPPGNGQNGGQNGGLNGGQNGGQNGDTGGDQGAGGDDGGNTGDGNADDNGPTDDTPAPDTPSAVDRHVVDPVADADEIDEPPYEDPTAGGDDDGGGDDEGCFSGFGAFFGCAGDQLQQVGEGLFVDGIGGDLVGMWNTVTNPVETWNGLMDYGRSLGQEWWDGTADAREMWGDGDYLGALLDWGGASLGTGGTVLFDMFIGDDVVDQWNSGNETRAVTTVLWNVGSLFIPGYGEAKIAEKIGALGRLGRLADDAAEAAQDAQRAARAGDLDALEDAARRADEAADEAEDAARRSGCTIAAPGPKVPYGRAYEGGGGGTPPALTGAPGGGSTVLAAAPARVPYRFVANEGCDEEAGEQARQAREQERQAYVERKRAEEPARAQEALENKRQWPDPERNDTSDPRNYNAPDWAEDLQTRTYGDADGSDGFWASRDRNPAPNWKNESWLRYQEQITNTRRGYEYVVPHPRDGVPDVEYDGWDASRRTYLEAKNGYASYLSRSDPGRLTESGKQEFVAEARRQVEAAGDRRVEWHFSNEDVADAARRAFRDEGLSIRVFHTEQKPAGGTRRPEAFD
ncbi:Tox-REase-5 domain-containing protein [Streptomyces cadmiisoli]|uniref:Tox-REase-5 domain-containing protein n=1 Tax=Streptomyces cadmiisoli TaxID=2184053 RepID=UPI003D70A921